MRWMTICIVAFWLAASSTAAPRVTTPAVLQPDAESRTCLGCHPTARPVLSGPMATRSGERAFAHRAFGLEEGDAFFAEACSGCHVAGCGDCHTEESHPTGPPPNEACLRCHRGYSVGWQYEGKAPREDHRRYQRGGRSQGEPFLSMLPDVHFEAGLLCADCHPMSSLHEGGRAMHCADCHPSPSVSIPEHSISAHMSAMECVACHAAWAPQEYGTFLIRASSAARRRHSAPARMGTMAEECPPEAAGCSSSRARCLGTDRAHPASVHPLRHRRLTWMGKSSRGRRMARLHPAHDSPRLRRLWRVS